MYISNCYCGYDDINLSRISDQVDSIMSDQYRVSIDGNLHNNKKTQEKVRHLESDIKDHAKVDFFKRMQFH